jgi:hypothetical protein
VSDTPASYPFEFRALVVRELEAIGLGVKDWRDGGLDVETEDGGEQFLGLANLYRQVTGHPPEAGEQLVRQFLDNARVGRPEELAQLPDTLEQAAERLMARLGRPFEDGDKAPWATPVPGADDLAVGLVIDYPTMMAFVPAAMMARSDTPPHDWVLRGLTNLMARAPENWLQLVHEQEGIWCGHAEDSYDASRALVLCDLTGSDDLGWLVAVPARDWLFARKVEPAGLPYFHLLKVIAGRVFADQPYPISDQVYWVRPGRPWERFRIDVEDDKVTVYPPPEFAAALDIRMDEEPGAA